ncbi:unnamed protein product [Cladocopium goreaui]|uniref:Uncharacterized protein n=1 Tax=Cladocopium goreaui TaxID=2562237 RepID=A0A9P1BTQ9_9DINO|nr:unnamed protein product [Cladocopium goreaui]
MDRYSRKIHCYGPILAQDPLLWTDIRPRSIAMDRYSPKIRCYGPIFTQDPLLWTDIRPRSVAMDRYSPKIRCYGPIFTQDPLLRTVNKHEDLSSEGIQLLPKQKFTGRKLARYQDPGMWPAEGLLKRLMRNNDRESLQLVAASATAYLSSRLRLEQVMQRDKLKRFPVPLPRLDPQRSTAAVLQAAAAARAAQGDRGDEGDGDSEVGRRIPGRSSYRALPAGIQHYTWKVPLSGSHAAAVAAALDILRPESALIFVCPNAGESVKGVVKDLTTAGWSNVDTLSRALFPDSRSTNPGKKASQVKGEAKGWRSANRLVELRDATKRGYSQEGDFYREAPIFVSAEDGGSQKGLRNFLGFPNGWILKIPRM